MEARVAAFVSIVVGAALLALPCSATQYTVGDSSGWDLSTDADSWLDGKTFHVGDTLVFKYSSTHNVMEVSKDDYDSCQAGNALKSYTDGNTQMTLKSSGTKYFICGTAGHCDGGMKLAVNVKAAASDSPAGKSPSASGSSSTLADSSSDENSGSAVSAKNVGLLIGVSVMVAGFMLF